MSLLFLLRVYVSEICTLRNDWHQSRLNSSKDLPATPFLTTKGEKKFIRAESRTSLRGTKKIKSNCLRHVTRTNSKGWKNNAEM